MRILLHVHQLYHLVSVNLFHLFYFNTQYRFVDMFEY